MNRVSEAFERLWGEALGVWQAGGWCMPAIALVALIMFSFSLHLYRSLRAKGFDALPEARWRDWIERPGERSGPIGCLLDFVSGGTLKETGRAFRELRASEIAPIARDLRVLRICVGAAPLLGLLGTVTGMLATFDALATGSGGEKTMALVAQGISEALITTETGLVIALPGLFLQYLITRKLERYKVFLAHLETVFTQDRYRQLHRRGAA